jgi:hypothetical protein
MKRDVYLVMLELGRRHEQAALELLVPMLHRVFPGARVRGAVVDNALAGNFEIEVVYEQEIDRISGDNGLREFTGWDRGLAWLERRYAPLPNAIYVLANDTVVRDDKLERVQRLPAERAQAAAARGALVGWVDAYPRPFSLFGLTLRQWVDTSLVIAERRTLEALRPLARTFVPDGALFAADWRDVFREPSPLSENYRGYLKTWLFGERDARGEFEHNWYAKEPLSAANYDAFKAKIRCILCEHHLSALARARGIPLVDIRPDPLAIDPFDEARVA